MEVLDQRWLHLALVAIISLLSLPDCAVSFCYCCGTNNKIQRPSTVFLRCFKRRISSRVSVFTRKCRFLVFAKDDSDSNDEPADELESGGATTPCVRICRYNADFYSGAVCIGCFREIFEIQSWASMTAHERVYALQDAQDRFQAGFEGSISLQTLQQQTAMWEEKHCRGI